MRAPNFPRGTRLAGELMLGGHFRKRGRKCARYRVTWTWGSTGINAGRTWPTGVAVYQGGPLYVAYIYAPPASIADGFRIARGLDNPDGTVSFTTLALRNVDGTPLSSIPLTCEAVNAFLPRFVQQGRGLVSTIPRLAADPTDPQRLFLVYHAPNVDLYGDKECPPVSNDVNVDVYLRRLTVEGVIVTVGDPVRVNDPDPVGVESPADQFLPSILVDSSGRIHVTIYDDRDWPAQQDKNLGNERFNVYYAFSDTGGANFAPNLKLFQVSGLSDPPAGDRTLIPPGSEWELGEYQGLSLFTDTQTGAVTIWSSFSGSSVLDLNVDKSVIWASRVLWQ
ncbi:MAG: hypothetical protein U1D55_13705 [Phycisphaerae bacterium]